MEALCAVAAKPVHDSLLGVTLDALGDELEAECLAEPDDSFQHREVFWPGVDLCSEPPVDLHDVDRQALEVGERCVPGAEVVERQLDASVLESGELQLHAVAGGDENALGELERQERRRQLGAFERAVDVVDELGVLQLPRRDVDGDADVATERLAQPGCVQTGLVQVPAADRADQAGLFRQRDAVEGRNLAEGRVLPAKQRLEPDHLERLELYDRLVGEGELLLVERPAQLCDPLEAVEGSLVEVVVVERVVRIAVGLRAVHRGVGLLQQLGAGLSERDSDARRDQEVPLTDVDGGPDLVEQALGDDGRLGRLVDGGEEHGELVASEPRNRVARADDLLQPVAEGGEHLVAHAVAELVVDLLELVEVDENERRLLVSILADRDRMLQLLVEESPVREARQWVEERLLAQLLLELAFRSDVDDVALQVQGLPGLVEDDHALVADRYHPSIPGQQAVLEAERLVSLMRVCVRSEYAVSVVRMKC